MKVILDREILTQKLNKAIRFIPGKQIIPAFENFMFIVNGNKMEITATDSNTQVKLNCDVKSNDAFGICVPAKLFLKTISLFSENEVTITLKSDTKIEVKSGKSKYNITMDCFAKDFGTMPIPEFGSEITMHQFMLKIGLKSAKKFVDDEHPNANMAAININEIDNKIIFTGLTKVLICRAAITPISINHWDTISIKTDTANKVVSLLSEKEKISITHSGDKIRFFTSIDSPDYFEVMSVTANITFPNSESLYKQRPENVMTINTVEFLDTLKRLRLYTSIGAEPCVKISNDNTQELKLISVDDLSGKDGEEIISIINPQGVKIDKVLANDSVIQVLSGIEAAEINFYFVQGRSGASFIIPKVNTSEEDIFNFLISSIYIP